MTKKLPSTWEDRNPLKGLMPGSSSPIPLDLIRGPEAKPRGRDWERQNRAFSYIVPLPLHPLALQVREDILSIAQFDADGSPRTDGTTTDDIASVLMDRALYLVAQSPALLAPRLNPHSRKGQMTVSWEAWDTWQKTPVQLKKPVRRQNKTEKKVLVLTFRWGREVDSRIKDLAGAGAPSEHAKNPLKFSVPVGDLVVRLLQLAIEDYKAGNFKLKVELAAVSKVTSWEKS
jgi:hypothetical protein